jgi:CubicO group peptidase (beta-lactamase class C family)
MVKAANKGQSVANRGSVSRTIGWALAEKTFAELCLGAIELQHDVEPRLSAPMAEQGYEVGLADTVVDSECVVMKGNVGIADSERLTAVRVDTLFRIGSISKRVVRQSGESCQ